MLRVLFLVSYEYYTPLGYIYIISMEMGRVKGSVCNSSSQAFLKADGLEKTFNSY